MNSKKIGNITEIEVALSLMKAGLTVLTPYGDNERYDLVVDCGKRFVRIQCKTSHSKDKGASFIFSGRSTHRRDGKVTHCIYTAEEIDYFATSFGGQCYLVPVAECKSDKILRIAPPKNKQTDGICWADDYALEKVIRSW